MKTLTRPILSTPPFDVPMVLEVDVKRKRLWIPAGEELKPPLWIATTPFLLQENRNSFETRLDHLSAFFCVKLKSFPPLVQRNRAHEPPSPSIRHQHAHTLFVFPKSLHKLAVDAAPPSPAFHTYASSTTPPPLPPLVTTPFPRITLAPEKSVRCGSNNQNLSCPCAGVGVGLLARCIAGADELYQLSIPTPSHPSRSFGF